MFGKWNTGEKNASAARLLLAAGWNWFPGGGCVRRRIV